MSERACFLHALSRIPRRFLQAACLTCDGLEEVRAVLHVVVSVVVVRALAEYSALLVGGEILLHCQLNVLRCQLKQVVAVVSLPEQKLSLMTGGEHVRTEGSRHVSTRVPVL